MIHLPFEREPRAGSLIRGDVRVPDGPFPRSVIVIAHGFKGHKDWGFFPWVAGRLAAAGHSVVTFNFSGCGVGPMEGFTDLEGFAANTFTQELDDLEQVVRWVRETELVPGRPTRLGLLGHSRGGATAILLAGRSRVDALATWGAVASFDRWDDAVREQWRSDGRVFVLDVRTGQQLPVGVTLLEDFEAHRARLDVGAAARRVTAPWLIVHGEDDLTVFPDEARELARYGPSARLHLVPGAGHTFETGHPFGGPSPQLREVLTRTERHFASLLEP